MKKLFLLLLISFSARAENVTLFFEEIPLRDLVKLVYGEIMNKPFVLTPAALQSSDVVTVSIRQVSIDKLPAHIAPLLAGADLEAVNRAGVVFIGKKKPDDDRIIVYMPRHRSARYLSDIVQPLTGARSLMARQIPQQGGYPMQAQSQGQHGVQNGQQLQLGGGNAAPTSVAGMTDKGEVDQIAFSVPDKKAETLLKLLAELDTPTSEVMLKAAVFEVATTKQDGSALQLALNVAGINATIGTAPAGDASIKIKLGGIDAIVAALDRDSRFRSVSRPNVRVRNGYQAKFSVGQDVPVMGAQQLDRQGNPIQSVDYKPSGIILTAKPEIRRDVIELDISQELSNFVQTNTGVNNSPTLIKRSVATRLGVQPGEVVALAGLQDEKSDGNIARVPLVGWLLGQQEQSQQTEILVFIEAQRIY